MNRQKHGLPKPRKKNNNHHTFVPRSDEFNKPTTKSLHPISVFLSSLLFHQILLSFTTLLFLLLPLNHPPLPRIPLQGFFFILKKNYWCCFFFFGFMWIVSLFVYYSQGGEQIVGTASALASSSQSIQSRNAILVSHSQVRLFICSFNLYKRSYFCFVPLCFLSILREKLANNWKLGFQLSLLAMCTWLFFLVGWRFLDLGVSPSIYIASGIFATFF